MPRLTQRITVTYGLTDGRINRCTSLFIEKLRLKKVNALNIRLMTTCLFKIFYSAVSLKMSCDHRTAPQKSYIWIENKVKDGGGGVVIFNFRLG